MPSPGQTSIALADLRMDARQRSDTENDPHIGDVELNRWIRTGYAALYDQLISLWGEDFFVSVSATITTDGQNDQYPLPADHYKNLLTEVRNSMALTVNNGVPAWITVHPFPLRDKNRYNLINFASYFGYLNVRYRITGSTVQFAPMPTGGQVFRLWYAPRLMPLADTGYITLSGVVAGDALTVNGTTFTAVASGATGTQFNVGATDGATATNLAAAILASLAPLVVACAAGPTSVPTLYQGAEGQLSVPARPAVPANVIAMTIYNGSVTWAASAHMALVPGAQGGKADATVSPTTYTWSDVIDCVSEWWELVSCHAAVQALLKQERDPSGVAAQKTEVQARLDRAAPNRNLGDPATVVETQGDFMIPGLGGPGWPGGSYY